MADEDPRITRVRNAMAFTTEKGVDARVPGYMARTLVEAYEDQVAVHRQTSEDLQAWRRRAQAAEAELTRARAELSTWLTLADGVEDPDLLALRDWVDSGFLGPIPAWPLATVERVRSLPEVAHKGPSDTDAAMFSQGADRLERGYPLGGRNLTRAVVELIRREVAASQSGDPS